MPRILFFLAGASSAVILCCAASELIATEVTVSFEGSIDFTSGALPLDGTVGVGTPFVGGYSFDSTGVTDIYPDDPLVGSYSFGSSGAMWLNVGAYEFCTNDLGLLVWNIASEDLYEVINLTPFPAGGFQWSTLSFVLDARPGNALDTDELPLGVPLLADWPDFAGIVLNWNSHEPVLRGRLTSIIPEPGTLGLLLLSVGVLMAKRTTK